MTADNRYEEGMAVRRKILGAAHVDRANRSINPLNREFQDLITRYGWGEIWTRPGFDHRTRRILVIGTMMGLGRWEEFRMHVRAALEDGFDVADLREIFLQQAIYCGLPIANTGFHHLAELIEEVKGRGIRVNGLEE